jgi:NADH:ubiquinone oxidoreductase subunit 2 (subunit N)
MIVTGGVWAAFQQNLNRIFGYAVIFETGIALLALSAQSVTGLRVFAYAFLPRLLTLGVWALALSALKSRAIQPELDRLKGKIAEAPFAAIALVIACFSLGGLPLLASFPVRLGVMAELARFSPIYPLLVLLGSTGFLFSGFRLMMVLVGGERRAWLSVESRSQQLFLAGGSLALLLLGWFPRAALGLLEQLLRAFPNLP